MDHIMPCAVLFLSAKDSHLCAILNKRVQRPLSLCCTKPGSVNQTAERLGSGAREGVAWVAGRHSVLGAGVGRGGFLHQDLMKAGTVLPLPLRPGSKLYPQPWAVMLR